MKVRAQSSVEYLALLSFLMILLAIFFFQANQEVGNQIRDTAATEAVEKIAQTVNEASRLGPGTKLQVWIDVPPNVDYGIVQGREVGFRIASPNGPIDMIKYVDTNVTGVLSKESGKYLVAVEILNSGRIIVGCGIVVSPLSVSFIIVPGTTETVAVNITNACDRSFESLATGSSGGIASWIVSGSVTSSLGIGASSQFDADISVPGGTAPGTYHGYITITGDDVYGEVPVSIRISDTSVPTASDGAPTGSINDSKPLLMVTSSESAVCKGSINVNRDYDQMTFTFSGTGTSHSYLTNLLSNGEKTVYVRCRDSAGNTMTSSYSWTFTVNVTGVVVPDTEPPIVNLVSPANAYVSTNSNVTFEYNVTDVGSGVASCKLLLNGVAIETDTTVTEGITQSFTVYNMSDGGYTWGVNCTDTSSNHNEGSSVTRSLTIASDLTPPVVTLISPANAYTSLYSLVTFVYNVTDAKSGIANCSLIINGAVNQTDNTITEGIANNFTATLANGAYTWSVNCTDDSYSNNKGSSATRSLTVAADTTPPVITFTSIGGDLTAPYATSDNTPDVVVSLNEVGDCYASTAADRTYDQMVAGGDTNCVGDGTTTATCTLPVLTDGSKTVYVSCRDALGNKNDASNNAQSAFTVDTTGPTITLNSPADNYKAQATTVTFSYTPNDATSGIANCKLYIDGGLDQTDNVIEEGIANTFSKAGLSTGSHTWYITCTDDSPGAFTTTSSTRTVKMPKAYDGWETNTWTGGWGWNAGSNWVRSSTTYTTIQAGGVTGDATYQARIHRAANIYRIANTAGMASPKANFWVSLAGISGSDRAYFDYSTNGASWTTARTWSAVQAYTEYSITVPASATLYIRFRLAGNANSDYMYIDYVTITNG